jgi:putative DNA primase/helicase
MTDDPAYKKVLEEQREEFRRNQKAHAARKDRAKNGGRPKKARTTHGTQPPAFSDDALALAFADRHAGEFCYVADWGKWLNWDSIRWELDHTLAVFDRARTVCRAAAVECSHKPKLAKDLASAKTRAAVVSMAREDRRLATAIEQWDAKPWLFTTGEDDD